MIVANWQTWNDYTVSRLAQTIFDDKRFDLAPILADALEEAGHPDADLPPRLREPPSNVTVVRLIAPIIGGELAQSVAWIEGHAKELGPDSDRHYGHIEMSYEDLMRFAAKHLADGTELQSESDGLGFKWANEFDEENFWTHYQVVTGESVEHRHGELFTCCV